MGVSDKMAGIFGAVLAASVSAGAAQAATLKIELWDVLAGPSTCCAPNPTAAAQDAARVAGTGSDTVLLNLPSPTGSANYMPSVNAVIAGEAPSFTFDLDSALLATGFHVKNITGLAGGGQTLNDFFGFDIDGAGAGIGNNSLLGTILRITGLVEVTNGDKYKVWSDDGYSVAIGDASLVQNVALQAPRETTHTFNGTSGVNTFSMVWFENQRVEGALRVKDLTFVAPVPLPAGLPLLLAGIGAFALAARRKKAARAATV